MKSSSSKTLVLASADIQRIILDRGIDTVMDNLIERMFEAFLNFDSAKTDVPPRSGFHYESPVAGLVEWMPLHSKGREIVIKVVGYHPANPRNFNLPTILSTISAYETATGHLRGVMDGVLPTALRTGAASAVASKMMAHPDSSVLGLIGCGAQAVTQLHAISRLFKLKQVLVYDVDPNAMKSLETRCQSIEIDVEIVHSTIPEIVQNADILCTATSIDIGEGPLFEDMPTKPHLHINAVGSDFPGKVEVPISYLERSFVCPDFMGQALIEGECQRLDKSLIGPELVTVIQDSEAYKFVQQQCSVFDSTGYALEDQVVFELFLEYAQSLGLGQEIDIEDNPADAKSPYQFLDPSNEKIPTEVSETNRNQ